MERSRTKIRKSKNSETPDLLKNLKNRNISVSFQKTVQERQFEPVKTQIIFTATVPDNMDLEEAEEVMSKWCLKKTKKRAIEACKELDI